MSEQISSAARNRFLLTSLGVMFIFILTLVVLLAAYPIVLAPPATLTPTRTPILTRTLTPTPSATVTLSPTSTRTLRPTFSPTATLTPSLTQQPSETPTPPGPPTLTPARPVLGEDIYTLLSWSPEEADRVVTLIDDYPNTLPRQARGENDENYYAAYSYPIIGLEEALKRFPDTPQTDRWRWMLSFDLARTGSDKAAQAYADLVSGALNRGETSLEDLSEWFTDKEPRLELEIAPLQPLPGYLSSHLVRIGGAGSAVFLIVETPSAYQAYALTSDFNFANPVEYRVINGELTGDGIPEAIIYPELPNGALELSPPRVFDLGQLPPAELPFSPVSAVFPSGTDVFGEWEVVSLPSGTDLLGFEGILFPACPVHFRRHYTWNGEWFDAENVEFRFEPSPATLAYCEGLIEHAARNWGALSAIQLIDRLLPEWPPERNMQGKPYPADAVDEMRYRKAIYHALIGEDDQTIKALEELIQSPTVPQSQWIEPAQQFLERYSSALDVYITCVESPRCDPRAALVYFVENLPPGTASEALSALYQAGMSQRASGYYDFDGDGTTESWFTVRHHPTEKLELWILAADAERVKAIFVDTLDADTPTLVPFQEGEIPPRLILDGKTTFQINRLPGSLQPYITYPQLPQFYPNRFEDALQAAIDDLFENVDPADISRRLLALEDSPGLLCAATFSCDRYYYVLGLAAELSGNDSAALEHYLKVWWDNSKSPFTSMVRLRLKGPAVLPSVTPLPTGTATITPLVSLTPTITGTPPTATLSPTVTLSPTPYPAP